MQQVFGNPVVYLKLFLVNVDITMKYLWILLQINTSIYFQVVDNKYYQKTFKYKYAITK